MKIDLQHRPEATGGDARLVDAVRRGPLAQGLQRRAQVSQARLADRLQRRLDARLRTQGRRLAANARRRVAGRQAIAALGLADQRQPQRRVPGQGAGQIEQRLRLARLQFQLELADSGLTLAGAELAAIQGDLDQRLAGRDHADSPLDPGGEHRRQRRLGQHLAHRRAGQGVAIGRRPRDRLFPFAAREHPARRGRLQGLLAPALAVAHPQAKAGPAQRVIGGVVIGGVELAHRALAVQDVKDRLGRLGRDQELQLDLMIHEQSVSPARQQLL